MVTGKLDVCEVAAALSAETQTGPDLEAELLSTLEEDDSEMNLSDESNSNEV